jgi:hypothetical protein
MDQLASSPNNSSQVLPSQTGRLVVRVEDPYGGTRGAQASFEIIEMGAGSADSRTQLHLYGPMNQWLGSVEQRGSDLKVTDSRGRQLQPDELARQFNTLLGTGDWLNPGVAEELAGQLLYRLRSSSPGANTHQSGPIDAEFSISGLRLNLRVVYDRH